MYRTFLLGLASLMALSTAAFGQNIVETRGSFVHSVSGYRNFASTAAEGYLQGQASLTDAAGDYNLETSQALINREQAKALAIENDRLAIQNYFQRQEMNRQYRASQNGPRPTMEDMIRRAKEAAPERLSRYELDPVFGTITWPAVLQGPQFAEMRALIERNFRDRDVLNSGLGSPVQRTVARATDVMEDELKTMVTELNPNEYVSAKRFLQSLAREAEHSPSVEGVALSR